jgi:hypothetical protein
MLSRCPYPRRFVSMSPGSIARNYLRAVVVAACATVAAGGAG